MSLAVSAGAPWLDPRDQVLLAATPTLMVPRFGTLPPATEGSHRFLVGAGGLYMQARSRALDATVLVAPSPFALPYGVVKPTVAYRHGAPSPDLLRRAIQRAAQVAPNEWAGVIVLDRDGYRLVEPPALLATPGAVSYATTGLDSDALVIDLHSHGDGSAFFSPTDDASDREGGIYIATVLGRCRSTTPKMVSRLVVNGHFFPFEAHALTPGHYREMRSDYQ